MKILIIDDERAISEFIKVGLEAKLFNVEIAYDGERGAFLGRTGNYDLIILDYNLPKLNGAEVLSEIRQEKKHIPVIMLSVKSEMITKKEIFDLGVDDYLTKPFLFEELFLHIQAVLRRPGKIEGDIYKIDNLTLSTKTNIVRRGGRELYLTRREFTLLEYLMKHRGQIISRQQILEQVWDYNADPFSNSVEAHITSLRRKLNINKSRNLIFNFPGRGYKIALNKLGNLYLTESIDQEN